MKKKCGFFLASFGKERTGSENLNVPLSRHTQREKKEITKDKGERVSRL